MVFNPFNFTISVFVCMSSYDTTSGETNSAVPTMALRDAFKKSAKFRGFVLKGHAFNF